MSHGDYIPKLSQIIQISFQRVGDIPTEVAIYLCAFQDLGFRGVQGEPLLSEGNAEVRKGSFTVGFAGNYVDHNLSCFGNLSGVSNVGFLNTVSGTESGQCVGL